jgi:hypothetical protein
MGCIAPRRSFDDACHSFGDACCSFDDACHATYLPHLFGYCSEMSYLPNNVLCSFVSYLLNFLISLIFNLKVCCDTEILSGIITYLS